MCQPYHPTGGRCGHQVIPSSASMRIYVPLCTTHCPDSRHIRENLFGERSHHKRPARRTCCDEHAAYCAYRLPIAEREAFTPTLLAHSITKSSSGVNQSQPVPEHLQCSTIGRIVSPLDASVLQTGNQTGALAPAQVKCLGYSLDLLPSSDLQLCSAYSHL